MSTPEAYISYFTPSEISPETLEFILVKRHSLVERLVERVRDSALTQAKYQSLVLGPRGMGKSHVVALVYHRIKAMDDLNGKIAIAWLAEEEWSVASLVDLYVVILEALDKEYGDLQKKVDDLYGIPIRDRTDAAAELLSQFIEGKTLFLLIENLEEIFRGLSSDELWTFRSFLSKKPFATILATTPSLFNGVDRQEEPFYGFFQPYYLDELTPLEATELLGKLAERREDAALANFLKTPIALDRVQAVHDLAGGNPRVYLLFSHLLTQASLDELVTPFLEFLDELTPYYQDKMKSLSAQQRKIVAFLSDRRGAIAVKDIVARTNGLTSQTASGQLDKLEEMGYVRKTKVGRESHYELREPLLRMVIEKKRGRGEPIRLVVDFLRRWYSRDERREWLTGASDGALITRQYLTASLDLLLALKDAPETLPEQELYGLLAIALHLNDYIAAEHCVSTIIERKGQLSTATDVCMLGICLTHLGHFSEAIKWYDKAIELDPNNDNAHGFRGEPLLVIGQVNEALASFDEAIKCNSREPAWWFAKAGALLRLGLWDAFLKALRTAFEIRDPMSKRVTELREFCRTIFMHAWPDEASRVGEFVRICDEYDLLVSLSVGLVWTVPIIIGPDVPQVRAEMWLAAWSRAGVGMPDLAFPLRLVSAAVAWKPKHDPRALLALAIEERRILESLLPTQTQE